MRFSQKIGKTSVRESIQIESIDTRLENRLWNIILNDFFDKISNVSSYEKESDRAQICLIIWKEFYGERADELPKNARGGIYVPDVIDFIKKWFFKQAAWYEKYDLIEFLAKIDARALRVGFIEDCNSGLKREMAGYRIVDQCIAQITSEEEIVEIEQALDNSSKWTPVNTHLKTALEYFSNRENPAYRNSIKEAISAVESLCIIITGEKKASLGQALIVIEKKFQKHGALKSAFSALYGYTSDSGGIRHSLLEDDITVSFEDAKFMLVSCSAFINYLKVKNKK
ncbi:hypothetical protein GCM10027284_22350 [Cyclobacterium sediminis]